MDGFLSFHTNGNSDHSNINFGERREPTVGMKRGSEELFSHSGMVANGTIMSPTQTNMDVNDAKKVKLDQAQPPPSKVLHIRNVPAEATEADILALAIPLGRPTNFVLLKKKAQALLEMESVGSATLVRDHYAKHPVSLHSKQLHIQFSNHTELKTEDSSQNDLVRSLLDIASEVMKEENRKVVLRVIVENMLYPVTVDALHTVFRKFGQVQKIITFTKNGQFQALIQMSNPISAIAAKKGLHLQNMYPDSCNLRVDFSKLTSLNVRYNNQKSRDFTNNSLPMGEGLTDRGFTPFGSPPSVLTTPFAVPSYGTTPLTSYGPTTAGGMPLYQSPTTHAEDTSRTNTILGNYPYQALVEAQMASYPAAGLGALQAASAFPALGIPAVSNPGLSMHQACPQSPVLLVTNLNEQKVTPDALFTLFGVYGDVQRVKIIYTKKDSALVQFADVQQAPTALQHLNNVTLYGKQIKVTPSKYSVVQLPKEGSQDAAAALTKDYGNSPLHRFKKPNSKNHQNIYPPSATLHLSNIPPHIIEEQLVDAFNKTGGKVVNFKFFAKDRKMALIQMSDVEQAVQALIAMHNYKLSDSNHLRVSFSKSTIPTN